MSALQKLDGLDAIHKKEIFDIFTDFPRVTSWNAIDWLDHFMDHFQTVDGRSEIGNLSYYLQNEWRIGLMQIDEREVFSLHERHLPEVREVWQMLKSIDPDFYSDAVLKKCALLAGQDGKHFFDFVGEVHCPLVARKRVKTILDEYYPKKFRRRFSASGMKVIFERR